MVFEALVFSTRSEGTREYVARIRWTDWEGKEHEYRSPPGDAEFVGKTVTMFISSLEANP